MIFIENLLIYIFFRILIFQFGIMAHQITISSINDQLNNLNWSQKIMRLDSAHVFKIGILNLVSSNLSQMFFQFTKASLKLLVLRAYLNLIFQTNKAQWQNQLIQTSLSVKSIYCIITSKLRKKNQVMDLLIFIISLLSRQFLQKIIWVNNSMNQHKILPKIIDQKEVKQKIIQQKQNNDCLLVEQYAFIILIYETTGNIVCPNSYQFLRNRIIERSIFQRMNSKQILQSLKYVKEQISKKEVFIERVRSVKHHSINKYIKSALKILKNVNSSQQKRTNNKKDLVSYSLHQMLSNQNKVAKQNEGENKKINFMPRRYKFNQRCLSHAAKYYYSIVQKDLSLLNRKNKRQHNSKQKPSIYFKQVKPIGKPTFHVKDKPISDNLKKQYKDQKRNWEKFVQKIRKQMQKQKFTIQKLKSYSAKVQSYELDYSKPSTSQLRNLTPIQQTISSEFTTDKAKYYHQQGIELHQIKNKQNIFIQKRFLLVRNSQIKFQNRLIQTEKNQNNQNQQLKISESTRLKKKVLNIKQHKKMFEEKCKLRQTVMNGKEI